MHKDVILFLRQKLLLQSTCLGVMGDIGPRHATIIIIGKKKYTGAKIQKHTTEPKRGAVRLP
jgi:hypothetical protein